MKSRRSNTGMGIAQRIGCMAVFAALLLACAPAAWSQRQGGPKGHAPAAPRAFHQGGGGRQGQNRGGQRGEAAMPPRAQQRMQERPYSGERQQPRAQQRYPQQDEFRAQRRLEQQRPMQEPRWQQRPYAGQRGQQRSPSNQEWQAPRRQQRMEGYSQPGGPNRAPAPYQNRPQYGAQGRSPQGAASPAPPRVQSGSANAGQYGGNQPASGRSEQEVRNALPAQSMRPMTPPNPPRATLSAQPQRATPSYQSQATVRPALPGASTQPSGHLGAWLNEHRNQPVTEQERTLRNDPSFQRLNPNAQQKVVQQLHQVNQLTPEQQQRRLGRTEMLERLTPQERMQVNASQRRWAALPQDRQVLVRKAFHDLGGVPLEQRQTVLNSSRYAGVFTPEERGILTNLLRVEPYRQP